MPMVRESMITGDCFSSAVNEPIGVVWFGLPIDAGISLATTPSMLTGKVWAEGSATPTPAALVPKLIGIPPAVILILECAGQNASGVNWTLAGVVHSNVPVA